MLRILTFGAALIALAIPVEVFAAAGDLTESSPPVVVVPQTTPAPQTPAYPTPPIGTYGVGAVAPRFLRHTAPHVVAPSRN